MRRLIKALCAAVAAFGIAATVSTSLEHQQRMQGLDGVVDCGWSAPEKMLSDEHPPAVASGEGQVRLLYKDWETATGYVYPTRYQTAPDCVAQSTAAAIDMRIAVQCNEGAYLAPEYTVSAPPIYGLARVEIAGLGPFSGPGAHVRWAMRAITEYGVLFEKNYLYAGYDLTQYDPKKSRTWGGFGVPDSLERLAKLTPAIEYYRVNSYEDVRDAIVAGYPIVVGSDVGFARRTIFTYGPIKSVRDKDGFLTANGTWNHAMLFCGVDDRSTRKGVCCLNSWGSSWVAGSTKLGNPPGSFWIDAKTVERMVKQGDSYAIKLVRSPTIYRFR